MDINDNFRLEEELSRHEGRRESAGEWSCDMWQETVAKQTQEEAKGTHYEDRGEEEDGAQGKSW